MVIVHRRDSGIVLARVDAASLFGAELSGQQLVGASLRGACLRNARLVGAALSGADLRWADLRGADLTGSDLSEVDLRGAVWDASTQWPRGFHPQPPPSDGGPAAEQRAVDDEIRKTQLNLRQIQQRMGLSTPPGDECGDAGDPALSQSSESATPPASEGAGSFSCRTD